MLNKRILLHQLFPFLAFIIFFSACSGKSHNEALVKAMEESLINSNIAVNNSTSENLHKLEEKAQDPASMDRANIWLPKAKQVTKLTLEILNHLEELKKENFINEEKSKDILARVLKYKEDVLNVDSSIRYEFAYKLLLISNSFDSSGQHDSEFWKKLLKSPLSATFIMLQSNIKNIENHIVRYCNHRVASFDSHGFFDSFSAIIAQSSKTVKAGEKIEITAGIGAFSRAAQPVIVINGKVVELEAEGFALYKFKASSKVGNHKVPVIITYDNPITGKLEARSIDIEYTVTKECDQ